MEIWQCILTGNDCYKAGKTILPVGIVVHSTGANNKRLCRYVQPDDGLLGKNTNKNDWNRPGITKCVHAFIGVDQFGEVRVYQTLPWNRRPWGCGTGSKGTYNGSYIQFEICEDALQDESYFQKAFEAAAELCAFLMALYPSIKIENVVSHNESHKRGYASGHIDCDHWLARFGKDMNWFRSLVMEKKGLPAKTNAPIPSTSKFPYKVRVIVSDLNVRDQPGVDNKVNTVIHINEVYTIIEEEAVGKAIWGRLKSGAGWINVGKAYVKGV